MLPNVLSRDGKDAVVVDHCGSQIAEEGFVPSTKGANGAGFHVFGAVECLIAFIRSNVFRNCKRVQVLRNIGHSHAHKRRCVRSVDVVAHAVRLVGFGVVHETRPRYKYRDCC